MPPEIRSVRERFVVYLKNDIIESGSCGNALSDFALNAKVSEIHDLSFVLWRENVSKIDFSGSTDHAV